MMVDLLTLALVSLCFYGLIDCRRRLWLLERQIVQQQIRTEKNNGQLDARVDEAMQRGMRRPHLSKHREA